MKYWIKVPRFIPLPPAAVVTVILVLQREARTFPMEVLLVVLLYSGTVDHFFKRQRNKCCTSFATQAIHHKEDVSDVIYGGPTSKVILLFTDEP